MRAPLGETAARRRLLAARAWTTISIPYFVWDACPGSPAKIAYLHQVSIFQPPHVGDPSGAGQSIRLSLAQHARLCIDRRAMQHTLELLVAQPRLQCRQLA